MHELVVAKNILDAVLAECRERGLGAVQAVNVTAAAMSCIDPGALSTAFEVLSKDTALAGARLHTKKVPLVGVCDTCGASVDPQAAVEVCPRCGKGRIAFEAGADIIIESVEVEQND